MADCGRRLLVVLVCWCLVLPSSQSAWYLDTCCLVRCLQQLAICSTS